MPQSHGLHGQGRIEMNNGETTGGDRTVICDISSIRDDPNDAPRTIRIVIVEGSNAGRQLELREGLTQIGRDADNELVLDLPSVSRRHAQVSRSGEICTLTDLGAANGVYVNSEKVRPDQPRRLRHGDNLALGKARLLFVDPESETAKDLGKRPVSEADSWIKRIYAIDPLAEKD
jgi:pSer/pThr/pTyr-binding forkhead associated (FHA) protein